MDIGPISGENPRDSFLETLMRFTPASLALAALLATVSSTGMSQRPDTQIEPLSIEWQKAGDAAMRGGDLTAATDAFESALAADPRNRAVYVALAQVARKQGLQGKAIRLYGEALLLDPTDVQALSGAGDGGKGGGRTRQGKSDPGQGYLQRWLPGAGATFRCDRQGAAARCPHRQGRNPQAQRNAGRAALRGSEFRRGPM
jgi:tetratricopeptide (TPR) repeat protein